MNRLMIGISAALVAVAIAGLVIGSGALASVDSDKAEIVALNQGLANSFNNEDVNASLAYYSDDQDALFYEDDAFELKGHDALRQYFQDFFGVAGHIQQELGPISVVVNGDLAAAHYMILMTWTDKSGANSHRLRYRYTQILKRAGGKWLIWHEHLSVPYDPATGKAVFDAKP